MSEPTRPPYQRPAEPYASADPNAWARQIHWPVLTAFALALAASCTLLVLPAGAGDEWRWVEPVTVILAAVTTVVSLCRRLPAQNVFAAAAVTALLTGAVAWNGAHTGIPFGPLFFTDHLGPKLFDTVPFAVPLLWVVVIVNGRGVARLILRPWRSLENYGFWVIGLTAALAVLFSFTMEPFAAGGRKWWVWYRAIAGPAWGTTPWLNFLGWFVTALFTLLVVTPWLIKKQPTRQSNDLHPLVLWLMVNGWFIFGIAMQELWPAFLATVVVQATVATAALVGARS